MTLTLVSAPAVEPLSVAEARDWAKFGSDMSDAVVKALIAASRKMIDGKDGWLGRSLITQTYDLVRDQFEGYSTPIEKGFYPRDYYSYPNLYTQGGYPTIYTMSPGIVIPLPPLQSVTSVKYLDSDGVQQTVDPTTYIVQKGDPSRLVLAAGMSWPSPSAVPGSVTIRFVAGYGDQGPDVPETMRLAIAMQAAFLQSMMQPNSLRSENVQGVGSLGPMSPNASTLIDTVAAALLGQYRVIS